MVLRLFGNSNYPKEAVIPMDGIHEDLAINTALAISATRSRQKRIYDPITITPPKDPLQLGKTARYIDKFNGLDITADIVSYSLSSNAYKISGNGVREMTINIEEPLAVI